MCFLRIVRYYKGGITIDYLEKQSIKNIALIMKICLNEQEEEAREFQKKLNAKNR
jgi:hypothetical protein